MNRGLWALLAFFAGFLTVPLLLDAYLSYGRPPVSVSDDSFPLEKTIVRQALHRRIDSEMEKPPFEATLETDTAGARIYKEYCAFCHGLPGQTSIVGGQMYPAAPQLWQAHRGGTVGVSDDPAGETYWRIKNGIRLTGMPSYQSTLSEQQMWEVSLLLSRANQTKTSEILATLSER